MRFFWCVFVEPKSMNSQLAFWRRHERKIKSHSCLFRGSRNICSENFLPNGCFLKNKKTDLYNCHSEVSRTAKKCSSWRAWESSDCCALSDSPELSQNLTGLFQHSPKTPQYSAGLPGLPRPQAPPESPGDPLPGIPAALFSPEEQNHVENRAFQFFTAMLVFLSSFRRCLLSRAFFFLPKRPWETPRKPRNGIFI